MGEISGNFNDSPEGIAAGDNSVQKSDQAGKIKTDVSDVYADGEYKGSPVFDVSKSEFYNNMKQDRKRLRFKSGSPASTYMRKTSYRIPFYIRNKEDGHLRKIK